MPCSRFFVIALVPLFGCAQLAGLEGPGDSAPEKGLASVPVTPPPPSTNDCGLASLELDVPAADFGEVRVNGTKPGSTGVVVRNGGAASVTVALVVKGAPGFTVDVPEITLAPNGSRLVSVSFQPVQAGPQSATLYVTPKGMTCNLPPKVALAGTGSDAMLLVQPGIVDFGAVDCGKVAAAKRVELTNDSTAQQAYSARTDAVDFDVSPLGSNLVPATSTVFLDVVPKRAPLTLAPVQGTLTVVTNTAREITMKLQPKGVILTAAKKALVLEDDDHEHVDVRNTGNRTAWVTASWGSGRFEVTPNVFVLLPGQSRQVDISFDADRGNGAATVVSFALTNGEALCSSESIAVTGKPSQGSGNGPG